MKFLPGPIGFAQMVKAEVSGNNTIAVGTGGTGIILTLASLTGVVGDFLFVQGAYDMIADGGGATSYTVFVEKGAGTGTVQFGDTLTANLFVDRLSGAAVQRSAPIMLMARFTVAGTYSLRFNVITVGAPGGLGTANVNVRAYVLRGA